MIFSKPIKEQRHDPRLYQITVLSTLIIIGFFKLDIEISPIFSTAIIITGISTQYLFSVLFKLHHFDPKSSLISGLSLCLLLRTNSILLAVLAAFITIASKFLLRWKNKHIFNPANFGLIIMIMMTNQAWVSPGQWGSSIFLAFLLACMGGLVVNHSERTDITLSFIGSYIIIMTCRSFWLGDPLQIMFHHIQNGAFIIFAFFMITDPKTTPNSRTGRILYAFLVASGAIFITFWLYRPNGLLISLICLSISVPLIDYLFPGKRYEWEQNNDKDKHNDKSDISIPALNVSPQPKLL